MGRRRWGGSNLARASGLRRRIIALVTVTASLRSAARGAERRVAAPAAGATSACAIGPHTPLQRIGLLSTVPATLSPVLGPARRLSVARRQRGANLCYVGALCRLHDCCLLTCEVLMKCLKQWSGFRRPPNGIPQPIP